MRENAIKILSVFLKEKGFKKKGQVWYLLKENVALMVEYQGSYHFSGFYANIGLYFPKLNNEEKFVVHKSYDWQIEDRYKTYMDKLVGTGMYVDDLISFEVSEEEFLIEMEQLKVNLDKILEIMMKWLDIDYFVANIPDSISVRFYHREEFFKLIKKTTVGCSCDRLLFDFSDKVLKTILVFKIKV